MRANLLFCGKREFSPPACRAAYLLHYTNNSHGCQWLLRQRIRPSLYLVIAQKEATGGHFCPLLLDAFNAVSSPEESVWMAIPSAAAMLRPVSRRQLSLTHLSFAPAGSFREQSIPCSDSRFGMPIGDAVSDGSVSAQAAIRRISHQSIKSPPLPLSLPPLESEKPPPSPLPSLQLSLQLSLLSESDATGAGGLAPATSRLTESMA